MTNLNTLLAERACERLILEYCDYTDTRQFDRLVQLFATSGVLNRSDTGELRGRAAIKAFFDALPLEQFVHASSNALVSVTGPDSATATSYVTVCRSHGQKNAAGLPKLNPPYLVARYVDRFVVEDGAWKFAYRDTLFVARG